MTEITRVPLHPIAKGSLTKLWLGIIAVILIGAGVAYVSIPAGVEVETVQAGTGPNPAPTDVVLVNYTGKLENGKVFDSGEQAPLPLDGMIPGFAEGALQMQKGGKYVMTIPAEKAYGADEKADPQTGEVVIPANSDLVFDVELIDFISFEDFQARMAQMQQMQEMMQQQGAEGVPGMPQIASPPPIQP
jgi:FKBP-type peptidyl-prolyl cis-trans isomerase FkpA